MQQMFLPLKDPCINPAEFQGGQASFKDGGRGASISESSVTSRVVGEL